MAVLQPEIENLKMGKGFKSRMKDLPFQRVFVGVYKGEMIPNLETGNDNAQSTEDLEAGFLRIL